MNTRKIASLSFGLLFTGVVGCGQGYTPSPEENVASPHGGGDAFDTHGDQTAYRTASYEVLRYTLTDVLNLQGTTAPNATTLCGATAVSGCPYANPVSYLDLNKLSVGAPTYSNEDPLSTQAPSAMTSGGFKVWALAASSACGRMMKEQATPALFPNGVSDYGFMYNVLLGRAPTTAEIEVLDTLKNSYTTFDAAKKPVGSTLVQVQGAAVCSAVLGSLEFLTVN